MKQNSHTFTNTEATKGFIALITAIIISIVLLTLTFVTSASSFSARGGVLNTELKAMSLHLAFSCANITLFEIGQNYSYTAANGETQTIGQYSCNILSVTYEPEDSASHTKFAIIQTNAHVREIWSTVETKISIKNPSFSNSTPASPNISIVYSKEM